MPARGAVVGHLRSEKGRRTITAGLATQPSTQPAGLHFTTGAIFGKFDDFGTNFSILGHDS